MEAGRRAVTNINNPFEEGDSAELAGSVGLSQGNTKCSTQHIQDQTHSEVRYLIADLSEECYRQSAAAEVREQTAA